MPKSPGPSASFKSLQLHNHAIGRVPVDGPLVFTVAWPSIGLPQASGSARPRSLPTRRPSSSLGDRTQLSTQSPSARTWISQSSFDHTTRAFFTSIIHSRYSFCRNRTTARKLFFSSFTRMNTGTPFGAACFGVLASDPRQIKMERSRAKRASIAGSDGPPPRLSRHNLPHGQPIS